VKARTGVLGLGEVEEAVLQAAVRCCRAVTKAAGGGARYRVASLPALGDAAYSIVGNHAAKCSRAHGRR
jgi:hypothetical protein